MANSDYEYVKDFELGDEILFPDLNLIAVQITSRRNISSLSQVHGLDDEKTFNLMNASAKAIMEKFHDIVFSYGFGPHYSFVLKKSTNFHKRRRSKIVSILVSCFTSLYTVKWKESEILDRDPPSFYARVIVCPGVEALQAYLMMRQNDCHVYYQYNTCLRVLVESGGLSVEEAKEFLEGKGKRDRNELLFKHGINYAKLPEMFRKGYCFYTERVEDLVKYDEKGNPVKRLRRKVGTTVSGKIASKKFWNGNPNLSKELGEFLEDIQIVKPEYIRAFEHETKLMPSTWIVIRIDGCNFHRFSEVHEFEKPNDVEALNLMNSCAAAVMEEFQDVIFAYGVSDEYSFVLKDSRLSESELVSGIVSFFTSMYVIKWETYFPRKELKWCHGPSFDGRAVCYPSTKILRDYLTWRQVDCHINNQYNTCFWALVKSGKSKRDAQKDLKGTTTLDKNKLLEKFNIDYTKLLMIFRLGSSVFWKQEENKVLTENGLNPRRILEVQHENIIEPSFWNAHHYILNKKPRCSDQCYKQFLSSSTRCCLQMWALTNSMAQFKTAIPVRRR